MASVIKYDWDPEKAATNLAKHKVSFEDAMTVFQDRLALSRLEAASGNEERWITIGASRSKE